MGVDRRRPSEIEFQLAPEPASVTRARHAVTGLARRLGAPEEDVALAVSEAVGNAVLHAFGGRDDGMISVSASPREGVLLVTVSDDGSGMVPDMESRGLGVGITLIAQVARDVHLSSSERGTTLSMSFELDAGGAKASEARAPEQGRR